MSRIREGRHLHPLPASVRDRNGTAPDGPFVSVYHRGQFSILRCHHSPMTMSLYQYPRPLYTRTHVLYTHLHTFTQTQRHRHTYTQVFRQKQITLTHIYKRLTYTRIYVHTFRHIQTTLPTKIHSLTWYPTGI